MENTTQKYIIKKDYKLIIGDWYARKENIKNIAKVYEVREKAIKVLSFIDDKPVYKWVPISQVNIIAQYNNVEKLGDITNHYIKCEISNVFIKENELNVPINDFTIEKYTDKALYVTKDDIKKWVPKSCVIISLPLSLYINKLDLINELGFINDIN